MICCVVVLYILKLEIHMNMDYFRMYLYHFIQLANPACLLVCLVFCSFLLL